MKVPHRNKRITKIGKVACTVKLFLSKSKHVFTVYKYFRINKIFQIFFISVSWLQYQWMYDNGESTEFLGKCISHLLLGEYGH